MGDTDREAVSVLEYSGPAQLAALAPARQPVVLRGAPLGPCSTIWTPDYLAEQLEGVKVPVHVATQPALDWLGKNFRYEEMQADELVRRAAAGEPGLYLRAVSRTQPRTRPTQLQEEFPSIAADFQLPAGLVPADQLFSSVLRLSSPATTVWTHYDIMDNLYCQVIGCKRAVLWPPDQANLLYLAGDKSRVLDIDNPDPDQFPLFHQAWRHEVELMPGDLLYIPALWFHNMKARDFGVAVNIFWKELEGRLYDQKDPYGNRVHLPAARADRMLDNVVRQLQQLPEEYTQFYANQLVNKLKKKCCKEPK